MKKVEKKKPEAKKVETKKGREREREKSLPRMKAELKTRARRGKEKSVKDETKRLLRLRQSMNRKRPAFKHQEHWKLKRFKKAPWRRPRGKRSKMRARERAKPHWVTIGYRGPQGVRGWHPRGLPEVLVYRPEDLGGRRECIIRIAAGVGTRKKAEIVKIAVEEELCVANPSVKFIKVSSVEELESFICIKSHVKAWYISEKATDEVREEILDRAGKAGIEVVE